VQADGAGQPVAFSWHGHVHRVTSIEDIREPRLEWWSAGGEVHRLYYLIVTHRGLICEISRDVTTDTWSVSRSYD
jgi:hypothetical protein